MCCSRTDFFPLGTARNWACADPDSLLGCDEKGIYSILIPYYLVLHTIYTIYAIQIAKEKDIYMKYI